MSTSDTWLKTKQWLDNARNDVEILQKEKSQIELIFRELQISPSTLLGTIITETGGIFFDHGWLRFLGSGSERMQGNLLSWNPKNGKCNLEGAFIVAYDVIGGFFAINGGAFQGDYGRIFYLEPDTLKWRNLGGTYSQLFSWAATANLDMFYTNKRWLNWQKEVGELSGDQGLLVYPFLWEAIDRPIIERVRRVVPMMELWQIEQDLASKIQELPAGTQIKIDFI